MGKSEGETDRKLAYVSIGLSLVIGLTLGGVILFLELKTTREISTLRSKVHGLTQEIIVLRHNLRHLNSTVVALNVSESSREAQEEEEYEEEYTEYDDPNNDEDESYDDEENYNDNTPVPVSAPSKIASSSLTLSDNSKNDTRTKRESFYNLNLLAKNIISHNNHENSLKTRENFQSTLHSSAKISDERSIINVLENVSSDKKRRIEKHKSSYARNKPAIHSLSGTHQMQKLSSSKKQIQEKLLSSELKEDINRIYRHKRGESSTPIQYRYAQFVPDESHCRHDHIRHDHCKGNNRRYHPGKHLKDWELQMGTKSSFEMKDGILTVKNNPGLYFIYAQVFFYDERDVCGFYVLKNNDIIFQCKITSIHENSGNVHKRNSCYSGSLVHLKTGDQLKVLETEENRITDFEKSKSFFGLFKVADI
ncbi:uncharacterized protein LOC142318382 [Lycorma delicatula]|uniref:uncharacterized protein LOC142318382 n=1 Tax=Lycorma delicatula TaxID=130591 RepID=UPI003F51ABB0